MKKFLSVLGAIFLLLLVGVGYATVKGFKLDSESRAYVHATLPKVLANSTTENFVSFMAPEDKEKLRNPLILQITCTNQPISTAGLTNPPIWTDSQLPELRRRGGADFRISQLRGRDASATGSI